MKYRYLLVGYMAKEGNRESTAVKGYIIPENSACKSYLEITKDCLDWANKDGDYFSYCQINFMQFVEEIDYNSFFGI